MKKLLFSICLTMSIFLFTQGQVTLLISYHSETGNTQQMARAVAEGAKQTDGCTVVLKRTDETTTEDILNADAIIVGSPVYNANISSEVMQFLESWPFEGSPLKNKVGAAFVTGGGISAGEEIAQMNILQSMLIFNMIVVGGENWDSAFGASAVTGEEPFENREQVDELFLKKATSLGKRVAEITIRINQ